MPSKRKARGAGAATGAGCYFCFRPEAPFLLFLRLVGRVVEYPKIVLIAGKRLLYQEIDCGYTKKVNRKEIR